MVMGLFILFEALAAAGLVVAYCGGLLFFHVEG